VIIISVGYYLRYNLSYRDVQEMLYDRGINVSHTTIYRWVQEYGKLIYQIWKKKNRQSFYSWKMDETYIKIKGKWHYLYRAIDSEGMTLFLLSIETLQQNLKFKRFELYLGEK
jgi:putative transposase